VNNLRLSRSAIGMACLLVAVAGCTRPASAPRTAAGPKWVGCSDTQRAAVGGGLTLVQICAELNARFYIGANAPNGGVRVARIVNSGPGIEERWGLEVDKEYLVIITPGGTGQGGRYQIVGPGNGNNPNRVGNYYQCLPLHGRPAESSARFGDCNATVTSAGTHADIGSSDDAAVASLDPGSGPAWISCETGCCTTDAPSVASLAGSRAPDGKPSLRVTLAPPRRSK